MSDRERAALVNDALRKLDDQDRRLITAVCIDGMPVKAACESLGIWRKHGYERLSAAFVKLARELPASFGTPRKFFVQKKVSRDDIAIIRKRRSQGASLDDLAREYGLHISTIGKICGARTDRYKFLTPLGGHNRRLSEFDLAEIRSLKADGRTVPFIAERFGRSISTIREVINRQRAYAGIVDPHDNDGQRLHPAESVTARTTSDNKRRRKRKREKLRRIDRAASRFRRTLRWRLWRAAPFCWYCGRFLFWGDATIDHLTPRAKGGGEHEENLKLCCTQCNSIKRDWPVESIVCSVQRGRVLVPMSEFVITEVNEMKNTISGFNYELVKSRDRKPTESHASEIRLLLARSTANIIDIGNHAQAVRDKLGATLFLSWVRAEFQWSRAQAYNYMRAADVFRDAENVEQFQPSAVVELSRQHVDGRAIAAALELAAAGDVVTRRRALALIAQYESPRPQTAAKQNGRPQKSSSSADNGQTDAAATGAAGGRPSPHSATAPIDAAGQWRSGVEVLRKLCEQPLKIPRADIEVLADQLLELALQLRTLCRNAPGERIDSKARRSASAAGRGKRRSADRPRGKAVA